MATPYLQVSRDASLALTDFSDELRQALALGDFTTWASQFGLVRSSDALKTVFPIPLSAAGYHEFKGDMKFRRLYERSLSMKPKTWQDGVEEFAEIIEAPDFIDWGGEPGRMATEWMRLPNVIVMAMLEANANIDLYRDADSNTASTKALFASDHPCNVLDSSVGSFSNDTTTTVADIQSGKFFDTISQHFAADVLGPNGRPLGLNMAGGNFLVPPARTALFKKSLELDTLIRSVNSSGALDATSSVVAAGSQRNIYAGTMGYTTTYESTQADYFYAVAAGKPGLYPWIVQQGTVEEIIHDKTSSRYKETLKVAIAEIGRANSAACLPHGIVRVHITG